MEEGLRELLQGEEAPRPIRWNQPIMVIISCGVILGILLTGVGFAIRCTISRCTRPSEVPLRMLNCSLKAPSCTISYNGSSVGAKMASTARIVLRVWRLQGCCP